MGRLGVFTRPASCTGATVAASRGQVQVRCAATAPVPRWPSGAGNLLLVKVVEALFSFPPLFHLASANARKMIVHRGQKLGLDFAGDVAALRREIDWDAAIADAADPAVATPEYYRQPFHAYAQGNLGIDAALEVTVAAKSVHCTVMDPAGKALDPEGDAKLRRSYSLCIAELLREQGARAVRDILDVGCATGLSSLELLNAYPGAAVIGVDLSPHFLAVGRHLQRQRQAAANAQERLTLLHRAAENTGLPADSVDLVSICLVCHELPESASRAVFKEAFRVLRPGGALSIMEMNAYSDAFQRILSSPVPYAIFKSTEPYLTEYVAMDMHAAIEAAGFAPPVQLGNSPRHRTVVATKGIEGAA